MAKMTTPNQYEELDEFNTIAAKLVNRYPDVFGDRKVDKIAAVAITNKDRPKKRMQLWEIRPVVPPITLFCNKEYCVTVYMNDWVSMNDKYKALCVADVLFSISSDGQGKTNPFDMKDHGVMLRTFGVDYLENPDAPDILEDQISWRVSTPPSGEEAL